MTRRRRHRRPWPILPAPTSRSATCRRSTCRPATTPSRAGHSRFRRRRLARSRQDDRRMAVGTQGVHVVGLDALHYFWSKRTPQELATDIASIVEQRRPGQEAPGHADRLLFRRRYHAVRLSASSQELQQRTRLLALMAPGLTTSFQVTIEGWLDIDDSGYDIVRRSLPCPPTVSSASMARTRTTAPAPIRR